MNNIFRYKQMNNSVSVCLLGILCFSLFALSGCTDNQQNVPPSPGGAISSANDTSLPENLEIAVIKSAEVGKPTELRLTATSIRDIGILTSRLEFICRRTTANYLAYTKWEPVDSKDMQIVAKSATSGELKARNALQFDYSLIFPYEGEWEIRAYAENSENIKIGDAIYWTVRKDMAGGYGSAAYIKDYSPPKSPTTGAPYTILFDMNKPPKLNEKADLTWEITVKEEIGDTEIWVAYIRLEPYTLQSKTFDTETMISSGEVIWKGSLTTGTNITSTATITFPEEGDWVLRLWIRTPTIAHAPAQIYLHVDKEFSVWGWAAEHK